MHLKKCYCPLGFPIPGKPVSGNITNPVFFSGNGLAIMNGFSDITNIEANMWLKVSHFKCHKVENFQGIPPPPPPETTYFILS